MDLGREEIQGIEAESISIPCGDHLGVDLPKMVGGATIRPLQGKGSSRRRGILNAQEQATIFINDFVIAATRIDNLPEVVGSAIIGPLQGHARQLRSRHW